MLIPIKEELDGYLKEVTSKIENKTLTCEDLNKLILRTMIGETTPESIRDRVRRRSIVNATESHIDNKTGHQALSLPSEPKRVLPKREPSNKQSHGIAKAAHKRSTKTQRRNAKQS